MSEKRVIRPSLKLTILSYIVTTAVLAGAAWVLYKYLGKPPDPWHALALVLFFIPIRKHLATRMISLTVDPDHLTFESGLLSRTRRTVDLSKVQDVTARQSLSERMLGMGDLMVETAGERSAIVVEGIDRPRAIADLILERSKELARQRGPGPVV